MDFLECPAYAPVTTAGVLMTIFAGLAAVCAFVPLRAQLKAKNVPALVLIGVTFIQDVMLAVNAPIWGRANKPDWCSGRCLCDVEVKLSTGIDQATIGGTMCIVRQLALIARRQGEIRRHSNHDERWATAFELFWCLVLPVLRMAFSYLIQPNRYGIIAVHGCVPLVYPSWPVFPIYILPPLLGAAGITWYAISAARGFYHHSQEIRSLMKYARSDTETIRILRLSILASILVLFLLPNTLYFAIINLDSIFNSSLPYDWAQIHPPGWADQPIPTGNFDFTWAIQDGFYILCGMMMFLFFSTTADTMQAWRKRISDCRAKFSRGMSQLYARATTFHHKEQKTVVEHF